MTIKISAEARIEDRIEETRSEIRTELASVARATERCIEMMRDPRRLVLSTVDMPSTERLTQLQIELNVRCEMLRIVKSAGR